MTPAALARLHARCFVSPPPFSVDDFAGLLAQPGVFLVTALEAFALGRAVADEAELLTLAVDPDVRRQGRARAVLSRFEDEAAARGAARVFLEVAVDNTAARALYEHAGFAEVGRRRGYYARPGSTPIDALVLAKTLHPGATAV